MIKSTLKFALTSIVSVSTIPNLRNAREVFELSFFFAEIAMETGQTVILTNLDNLYESLYDALNQNYMVLGDNR